MRPDVAKLHHRHPGILRVQIVDPCRLRRNCSRNLLNLSPANQQKRNAEEPAPCDFDKGEQRTTEGPTHLVHQFLGPANRMRHVDLCPHFTTRFTSLAGTTITFTTVFPAMRDCTFSSASAAASISFGIGIGGHAHHVHELAVDLHRNLELVFLGELGIAHGPGGSKDRSLFAQFLPQLSRKIGRERRQQQNQRAQQLTNHRRGNFACGKLRIRRLQSRSPVP